jgi:ribosomal protein RSM22 (predicted rRNA methylase)
MTAVYDWLRNKLSALGYEFPRDESRLASSVRRLSDVYQKRDGSPPLTPWREPEFQAAYLAYFFPLNVLRAERCLRQIPTSYWVDIQNVIDVGSGPGTFQWALHQLRPQFHGAYFAVESSNPAFQLHLDMARDLHLQPPQRIQKPSPTKKADRLLLIEPSQITNSRKLMELRQSLIDKGYLVIAPCTHLKPCPLLTHSNTDFCHDRFFIDLPDWLQSLHNHLPMQNRTLTHSYLVVTKNSAEVPATPKKDQELARVIGDTLYETGKVRQALCRGEERQFLSALRKHVADFEGFPHGSLLAIPKSLPIKGNELRVDLDSLKAFATVDLETRSDGGTH